MIVEEVRSSVNPARSAIPAVGGTYILLLGLATAARVEVGRLGSIRFAPGCYLYVGSAFGPGGLRARLSRHLGGTGRRHWHVDYLRAVAQPLGAWFVRGMPRREHEWSRVLAAARGIRPVSDGFGSSDCNCPTHLFFARREPSLTKFRDPFRHMNATAPQCASVQALSTPR